MASDPTIGRAPHDPPQENDLPGDAAGSPPASPAELLRLRAADVLARVSDAFVLLDPQWRIVYANPAACRINQKPLQEFVGRTHWEEWPASVGTELERQYRRAMAERVEAHFEHRYVAGPYDVWLEIDAYPAQDGLSLFYRDISARKRAEAALRRSQEDLRLAVDAAQIGTFYCDWPLDKIIWNDTCSGHFFLPPDSEVDFALFYSLLHPDDREPTRQAIERAMAERVEYSVEYRTVAPDGRTRWVNAIGRFYYGADGSPIRFDGITIDISARKAVEEEQRGRAERERFLADLAERARGLTDPDAVITDALRSVGEFLGVSRCVFVDIDTEADTCVCHTDYRADASVVSMAGTFPISAFGEVVVAAYAAGRWVAVDDVRADRDQVPEWSVGAYDALGIRAHVGVPVVHSARLVSCIGVHSATPRRWQPEEVELLQAVVERTWLTVEVLRQQYALVREAQERREAHERTANILESITDAFFALDRDWRFTYLNSQAERLLARARAQLLGRNVWQEFPLAVDAAFYREYHRAVDQGQAVAFEEYYPPPLDTWFEVRAYPSEAGLSVYFHDITERKRAEEERERRLAEQSARAEREALLNQIGQAIRTTQDPDEIQRVAVCALGETLRADRCYFSLYDLATDSNWVGQDFRRGDLPSLAGRYRLADFQVNPEDYYPDGRTFVVPDALDTAWSFPEALLTAIRQLRVRSAVGVPFFSEGRLVATLSVAMADEPRAWTNDEVRLVEAVASQARSAVEAARLLAEWKARLTREALLGRIGVAIRSTLDPDLIQERAATLLGEALRVDRCFYVTYDLARDHAQVAQDWHREDLPSLAGGYSASDFSLLLGELFPAQGAAAVVDDVRTAFSPAVASVFEDARHRAVLVVPFFDEGALVAALYASEADAPRAWTAEEMALVEQVATLTRTALEAARVQQREHRIAQQLQDALQPALPAHVTGLSVGRFTRPALDEAAVGGDFYDLFPLDKELYALVIGDVSGKGLAAAQQLALIRNSLRTTLYLYHDPARAASALNAIVTAHELLVGFVTAWVGVYDAATGRIRYASCGHEPGLVRRAGGAVEPLGTTGPPLGVAEGADYGELSVTLAAGDALLVYTDGLSEAGPSRRELLGTEGLTRLLAALPVAEGDVQTQTEALVAEVSAYAGGVFRDDVAALLTRRQ